MNERSWLSRRFAGNPWLLLIAAAGWVGCSFDSSKLSVSAKPDARVSTDLPVAPADAAFALADVQDTADQASDEPAIVTDGDSASEFEAPPDEPVLAPPDVAPAPEVAVPLDVVASPPFDTGSIDQVRLGDTAQAMDVAEDVPGDLGVAPSSDSSPDIRDSAADGDSAIAADAADVADAATTCGGPGQICCAGNTCLNSGCCVSGFCTASGSICASPLAGTCSGGACGTCGGSSGTCCTNSSCTAPHTLCQTSTFPTSTTCAACGGSGETCCPGNFCLDGGCCIPPLSGSGTAMCKAAGSQCSPAITATCAANVCGTCGGLGNPCCQSNRCTAPNTFCQTATTPAACAACGGANQPCCPHPTSGETATCSPGFTCQAGTGSQTSCVACGGSSQPCCAGSVCTTGTCKLSGTCP